MPPPLRRIAWPPTASPDPESLVTREWLVTNGLGGYASGTVAGVMTRRYHGLLIAALSAPLGRTVMLSHVAEQLRSGDGRIELALRPSVNFRAQEAPVSEPLGAPYEFRSVGTKYEIAWKDSP